MTRGNSSNRHALPPRRFTFSLRRITSYNVCYTKLLRYNKGLPPRDDRSKRSSAKGSKQPKKQSGGKTLFKVLLTILIVAVLGAGGVAGYLMLTLNNTINKTGTSGKVAAENSAKVVITSYSIHYTKLYDLLIGKIMVSYLQNSMTLQTKE